MVLHYSPAAPYLMDGRPIFLISKNGDSMPEPFLAISKKPSVIWVLLYNESIIDDYL